MALSFPKVIITKNSRLDISINSKGIYFKIYSKISEIEKNGKKLPLFIGVNADGSRIEDSVTVKVSQYELGLLINIFELYTAHPAKTDKMIPHIQKLAGNLYRMELVNNQWQLQFYRPERPWSITLLPELVSISIFDKTKQKFYSIPIPLPLMKYFQKVLEEVMTEYFRRFRYEEEESQQQQQTNVATVQNKQPQVQAQPQQIQPQPQQTIQPTQPEIIDDEDEFDFD